MEFNQESNHYELLDIPPDASPQEIRAAYMRARAAFQKDSLAIYSLMDPAEANEMIQKIENAYQVLSHPDRKRAYDQDFLSRADTAQKNPFQTDPFSVPVDKVVSIDRTPPMESSADEQLLVAPVLDHTQVPENNRSFLDQPEAPAIAPQPDPGTREIEEWSGGQIRKAREMRDYPIERLVEVTRIRRSYLQAIEAEDFQKLPAPVFVRGFLMQIARELKIPADSLMRSYLRRYENWKVSQADDSR
ncbi:hypothetical protein EBZ37_08255 [bacterium]|nr:hypothetical protein [bacterium]